MSKYDKAKERVKAEQQFEKEQEKLKSKYSITEENIIVKEKSGLTKFIIKSAFSVIRIIANIAIYALAATGLISLIYPNVRAELLSTLSNVYKEILSMF